MYSSSVLELCIAVHALPSGTLLRCTLYQSSDSLPMFITVVALSFIQPAFIAFLLYVCDKAKATL